MSVRSARESVSEVRSEDKDNDQEQSLAVLRRGAKEDPGTPAVVFELVSALEDREEIQEAKTWLRDGIWENLDAGDYSVALEMMKRLLKVDPDDIETYIEIAKTHLRMGSRTKAIEEFDTAFEVAIEQGDRATCEEIVRMMERVDPEDVSVQRKRATLLVEDGDIEEAVDRLREVAEQLEDEGQRQDFLAVGKEILELAPEREAIRIKVGEALIAEAQAFINYGLHDKAVQALCQAIKYTPEQIETYETLGRVLVRAGRREDAIDMAIMGAQCAEEAAQSRRLLELARKLSGQQVQIETMARELGIELGAEAEAEEVSSFNGDELETLGSEETSPVYSSKQQDQFEEGSSGPTIGPGPRLRNIVELLELIDGISSSKRVVLCDVNAATEAAELVVRHGRLNCWRGVEENGCGDDVEETTFSRDATPRSASVEHQESRTSANTDGERAKKGIQTPKQRERMRRMSAGALIALGGRARNSALRTIVCDVDPGSTETPLFSVRSLLIEVGQALSDEVPSELAELRQKENLPGDEHWMCCRVEGGEQYVPVWFESTRKKPAFREMKEVTKIAGSVGEYSANRADGERWGVAYLLDGYAWGAVVVDQTVLLLRVRQNEIGPMLQLIQDWTEGSER